MADPKGSGKPGMPKGNTPPNKPMQSGPNPQHGKPGQTRTTPGNPPKK